MNRQLATLLLAGVLGGAFAATDASAMQLQVTRTELCGISDAVVVGRVASIDTHWAQGAEGAIERHAMLGVTTTLAGTEMEGAVVVLPGGTIGDARHWVEDVPELQVDQVYALFLRKGATTWSILGGEAGAIKIADDNDWRGESIEYVRSTLEGCHE